jgi:small conductance mechanosensitive channel
MDLSGAFQSSLAEVTGWVEGLVRMLPEILAALVVLLLFLVLGAVVRRVVRSVMDRTTDHGPVKSLVSTAAYVAVLAVGLFLALGVMNLDKTVTSLLAGVGVVGLALGFAFQDIAENFIAGVLISVRRPFTDGDLIESNDFMGTVEEVDLRATLLRMPQGHLVRVPNGDVYGNPLTNYSQAKARRVDLSCGVSYGDDLEKARRVAMEAMEGVEGRDPDREVDFWYEEFGGSSINFKVVFWLVDSAQSTWLHARSDAMIRLKKAFDENDVGIPFSTVTLDFTEAGTRTLDEPLRVLDLGDRSN